jgi:hypothetical protein
VTADLRFGVMVGVALCLAAWSVYLLIRVLVLKGERDGAEEQAAKTEAEKAGLRARCEAQAEAVEAQRSRIDNLLASLRDAGVGTGGKPGGGP